MTKYFIVTQNITRISTITENQAQFGLERFNQEIEDSTSLKDGAEFFVREYSEQLEQDDLDGEVVSIEEIGEN